MAGDEEDSRMGDGAADALEEVNGFGGGEYGTLDRARRFVRVQIFLPRKDAVLIEEMRLRRMKKGQDISRSRLISEAVQLLLQAESNGKTPARHA